jgi:TonB family protein
MGYQALLFCPDEKLSMVVSQVFAELDFTVESVHEPFAAVKKLMAQRYDAIVVDSENEQNASLLFKSARNSSSNQSSLAIALVEGQAGVAKAYRIGANLVLTKPINVEQAKGTLRVARGLLRKNSDGAAAIAAGGAVPATPLSPTPVSAGMPPARKSEGAMASLSNRPQTSDFEAPLPAKVSEPRPAEFPAMNAVARIEDTATSESTAAISRTAMTAAETSVKETPAASPHVINHEIAEREDVKIGKSESSISSAAVGSGSPHNTISAPLSFPGSAAAPAPAKEIAAPPSPKNKTVESERAGASHADPTPANSSHGSAPTPAFSSVQVSDAPSFAGLADGDSSGSPATKKMLIVAAVVLVLAAIGYLGYGMLGKSSTSPAPQPASASQDSSRPAPVAAPISSPGSAPSANTSGRASVANPVLSPKTAIAASSDKLSTGIGGSPVTRIAVNTAAPLETRKPDSSPLLVTSNAPGDPHARVEEPAPQLPGSLASASANQNSLSGVISSTSSSLPKLSLSTLKISQGVSEGLLIKRVQPKYPQAALAVHSQGAVQIEATINKEGVVTNPRVLSGDPILAQAAVEAVRQWRYKPYYLDGQPVEIHTQITVNFRTN